MDDLVKRLREVGGISDDGATRWYINPDGPEAAGYIEKLVEENGVLFAANVRLNSRADLDSDGYVDRIEKLEAALHQWDNLIVQQFTGSKAAMSDMNEAAQITAALLHGDAPWPKTRIEKLEAALRNIINGPRDVEKSYVSLFHEVQSEARKALEGKDE